MRRRHLTAAWKTWAGTGHFKAGVNYQFHWWSVMQECESVLRDTKEKTPECCDLSPEWRKSSLLQRSFMQTRAVPSEFNMTGVQTTE